MDLLCKDINIPTVLQSLGCIAQHSVSVDLYGQITPLILKKIFKVVRELILLLPFVCVCIYIFFKMRMCRINH